MATVTVHEVTKQFGEQIVLHGVSLDLHPRETVGLIGPNGAGKTTLFRLLIGELAPDLGTVTRAKNLKIGFLPQEPAILLDQTLHDEVAGAFADLLDLERGLHDVSDRMASCTEESKLSGLMAKYDRLNTRFIAAGGHSFQTRLHEILGGLGFGPEDYERPLSLLSGGQRCRAALAKLLLQEPELLLLDEPTNHLDIDAVRWLERFLARHRGGAVIVSHDRYLLDRLCDRIIEVEHGRVAGYPGNYSNYAKVKEIRLLTEQRRFEKDADFIKKERAFIAKHLSGQRTKEAQGRRTRLERRLGAGEFVTETSRTHRTTRLGFDSATTQVGTVLRCEDLTMSFGDKHLFSGMTFQVQAGQRLAITGPNGTGKTTLIRILMGEVSPISGTFRLDANLRIGYYAQEGAHLDPQRTVLEEIRIAHPELSEQGARSYLGRYRFSGDDVFKTLGKLSGGERSRIRLATLISERPDVLVLDEPTNHLDIPSREVLEEALAEFSGTILVISHDRYFLDRIADRLLVIRPEGHRLYEGNYSYYIEQLEHERAKTASESSKSKKTSKGGEARKPRTRSEPSPYDSMSVEALEELVINREVELAAIQERFGDPEVYKDPDLLAELREEIEAIERELAAVDAAWCERVDTQ